MTCLDVPTTSQPISGLYRLRMNLPRLIAVGNTNFGHVAVGDDELVMSSRHREWSELSGQFP